MEPKYQVTRFCCTSGLCIECHQRGTGKRARIVHADNLSKDVATKMAKNWSGYEALMSEMPVVKTQ